ncbi:FG-GAP repeat protein [Streptomyces sp. NPDC056704]|uniref:FG-GAP and VCBS repeat-containing protein n=1 Tax=Streptomyces sp. NPDC056704 TaxID=3345917 RepID=UPI0036D0D721
MSERTGRPNRSAIFKGGNWNARLTGDFNRDGYADVDLNYRDAGGIGRVTWFKGAASGLTKVSTLSVKGGRSIAAGDVNGNGYDDIVIGQPYTSESGAVSGGQVTMGPGTATGFTTTGMTTIQQATTGVPGANESGDALGASVSVGDHNLDGDADVLAGAPNEDITRDGVNRSGAVAVSLTDLTGYGRTDLTVGTEGEDAGDGVLLHVPSGSTGLGLSQAKVYGRAQLGTPTGAHLGQPLTP